MEGLYKETEYVDIKLFFYLNRLGVMEDMDNEKGMSGI